MATGQGIEKIPLGHSVTFRKTVSESDVYLFAGITGDFDPIHVDDEFAKTTPYGRRVAHGVLIIGYMSAASSIATKDYDGALASLGYDRVRHVRPVFFGDTVTVRYEITDIDAASQRAVARVTAANQDDEVVAVAEHILKAI